MRKIISFYIKYPVWTSVLFFSVMGFGLIALGQIRYSFFPEIEPDTITVQVAYPGASPEEVAEGVVLKIEEALDGLEGVDRTTSVSQENSGIVTVELLKGTDLDDALADVKNAVDRISSFPVDVENPVIYEGSFRERALSVLLYGETDLYNLKYIAEDFRDEMLATDNISQVSIEGIPDLEFSIEVSDSDLRRYQLTFDEISNAVAQANVNLSGGKFDTSDEEILIRAWGRGYYVDELADIPVRGNADGTVLRLKDVATINEQWEDTPDKQYYNGRAAVILNIDQAEDEDIIAIAELAKEMVTEFNESHDVVEALVIDDRTVPLKQRVELLVKNGVIGLALVILALGFFLRLRLSWWVAVSIPFSFAGMFILAAFQGLTINVISLFGMILVVGILVDDAIVVGENIFSKHEAGENRFKAAVDGTLQMVAPVSTAVLTTVIAFLPFFFLDGMLGKFIWQMAFVVIFSLLFSLVEAFFVLPSHLAHSKALMPDARSSKFRDRIESIITFITHRMYAPSLRYALKHKWVTVVTPIAFVMLTIGLLGGGLIGFTFFPYIDHDTVPINVSLVPGRQEADTDSLLASFEESIWVVNERLKSERPDGKDVVVGIKRNIGSNSFGESGSHAGQLLVELLDGEERDMTSRTVADMIRKEVGSVPEAQNISFGSTGRFGKAISVSLLGNDHEELTRAKDLLVTALESYGAVKDVTDTDQEGRREVNITLKPRAYALGFTLQDIAGQVRQGFFGQEIQRIQRGRDEIRVWVRYRPEDRAALGFLDQMRIRTADGSEYPFTELADYTIERGVTSIDHLDRTREIKVEADQADIKDDLPPILAEIEEEILPPILEQVQGVRASFEGQSRDQARMQASMLRAFPIALLGMFILVTLVFRSYGQSLLIFSLIPIGMLGAIWGHGIQGLQINMLSIVGIIALSGIIINDSIVLVDQINRNLRSGEKVYDAVYKAGISRLRPILLTTLTTSLGLAPLILEKSTQAQFLIPLAVSVAYGLIFGTFILLVILPAAFLVFSSLRVRASMLFKQQTVTPESVEPAVKELKMPVLD